MNRTLNLLPLSAFLLLAACGGADTEMDDASDQMDAAPTESASKAPPEGATVRITSPADGAEIAGTEVTVTLEGIGIPLAPGGEFLEGTGHHHLFLDQEVTTAGFPIPSGVDGIVHLGLMETEYTFTELTPGEYTITAMMADGLHFPFDPPVLVSITITVVGG